MKKQNETKINFNVKATKLYMILAAIGATILAVLVLTIISVAGVNKLEKKTVPGIYKQTASKIDSLNSNIDKSINRLEGTVTTRFDELNKTLANINKSIENSISNVKYQTDSISKLMGTANDTNNTVFGRLNTLNNKVDGISTKLDSMDAKLDSIAQAVGADTDYEEQVMEILENMKAYFDANPTATIDDYIKAVLAQL